MNVKNIYDAKQGKISIIKLIESKIAENTLDYLIKQLNLRNVYLEGANSLLFNLSFNHLE